MLETVVSYEGGLRCRSQHSESGTIVLTDAPKDNQGQGESFSPSELLALSLGSCILSIMGIAARSMDTDIAGATAILTKEMANGPRRIVRLAVDVRVPGNFNERQRAKLEAAAHACPVHNALKIDAPITIAWIG
jgi:putative redox protein